MKSGRVDIELIRGIYRRMGQDDFGSFADNSPGFGWDGRRAKRGWSIGKVFITTHTAYYRALYGLLQIREYCEAIREQRPMRILDERRPRG